MPHDACQNTCSRTEMPSSGAKKSPPEMWSIHSDSGYAVVDLAFVGVAFCFQGSLAGSCLPAAEQPLTGLPAAAASVQWLQLRSPSQTGQWIKIRPAACIARAKRSSDAMRCACQCLRDQLNPKRCTREPEGAHCSASIMPVPMAPACEGREICTAQHEQGLQAVSMHQDQQQRLCTVVGGPHTLIHEHHASQAWRWWSQWPTQSGQLYLSSQAPCTQASIMCISKQWLQKGRQQGWTTYPTSLSMADFCYRPAPCNLHAAVVYPEASTFSLSSWAADPEHGLHPIACDAPRSLHI